MIDAATIASRLTKAKRAGSGWVACCPAHDDGTPSLSINDGEKGPVFKCHAGCSQESVLNAIEGLGVTIRKQRPEADVLQPLLNPGMLASAKGLELDTLEQNNVIDGKNRGVGFMYANSAGEIVGTKFRKYLGGGADRGFSWEQGSKPCLYGLWRLERDLANDNRIILCEGETDALTLWQNGYTALALPGANMWKNEWASEFPHGAKVYVIVEPDQGGRTVEAALGESPLKERAYFIRMTEAAKDPNALHMQGGFTDAFDKLIETADPAIKPKVRSIVLRHIADIVAERREPNWLIHKTLEMGVLAVIAGTRGTFKSFIALHWSMLAAVDGHPVVMLSAEGGGIDRRVDAWMRTYAPKVDLKSLPIVALERGLNLNSQEVMAELQEAIEAIGKVPHIVVIDTFSKFSAGIDENDNGEVAEFLQKISHGLREKYGCTVLLVAHAGHGDAKRPRGASTLMANPDAEYIVERPDLRGMLVSVSRDRFKDSPSMDAINYMAESVDLGRVDRYGDPVNSLIVRGTDSVVVKRPPTGKAQRALLAELERLTESGVDKLGVWTQDTLREMARGLGFHRNSSRDAVIGLVEGRFLIPTVGGYKLDSKGRN